MHADTGVVIDDSKCSTLPHVYSGVAFRFCQLNSTHPAHESQWGSTEMKWSYVLFDGALSTLADTLILPYTLYKQFTDDPIDVDS